LEDLQDGPQARMGGHHPQSSGILQKAPLAGSDYRLTAADPAQQFGLPGVMYISSGSDIQ